jgi:hypothetical protein
MIFRRAAPVAGSRRCDMTELAQRDAPVFHAPRPAPSSVPGSVTGPRVQVAEPRTAPTVARTAGRDPIVPADSALARAARDLVSAHRPLPGSRDCARCGKPSPCWTEMHARRVLAAAGEPDRERPAA